MNNIDLDKYYIINPGYKFKDDIKRIVLTNSNSLYFNDYYHIDDPNLSLSFSTIMHPIVAYMFAFFNGEMNLRDTITELSLAIDKPYDDVLSTFSLFIHNSEQQLYTLSKNLVAPIPKNFIIEKQDLPIRDLLGNIDIQKMLSAELDLNTFRNYVPNDVLLMVTNNCVTDCVYCYANRSHKVENPLTFERIKGLIEEAHSLGCKEFTVTGGDIFLYKKWEELLDVLHKHEYDPYLSTKIPIGEDIIIKLKERNIDKIQISLDTMDREVLKTMVKVSFPYLDKMKNTFDLLRKYNIKFTVKSVITKFNDDLTFVKKLVDFLLQYDNLLTLSIAPGNHSLYKHFTYKPNKENLLKIQEYVDELNHPKISMQPLNTPFSGSFEEKKIKHNNRAACSGNATSLFILPDGKVTICEQMYWTPFFIMGDVTNQSIMEVWNSPKALSLWNIKQEEIQDASPCKKCDIFERCRRGAGTCWRMAMQAYGIENYDFPDPDCPYAPPVTKPYYH